MPVNQDNRGLVAAFVGDGRPLLSLTGIALFLSGAFGIFQSLTGYLLPHDAQAINMDAAALARATNIHLVHFMFHDRVAFAGTLLAIGAGYGWLAEFPLKAGEQWAWWAFLLSGCTGFSSFLAYLGYGYLDEWHAWATIVLLPFYIVGMIRSRGCVASPLQLRHIWSHSLPVEGSLAQRGRLLIQACGFGIILASLSIIVIGMTTVFVPQDLTFMHLTRDQIHSVSPMLIPVIAHDRSAFGGGLLSAGVLIAIIARNATLTRSLVQILAIMGFCGFGAALGVHSAIGYLDFVHLAPAYLASLLFLAGWTLCLAALRHAPVS